MRRDQRRLAHRQRIVESLVGNVRDIDHDSEAVHLANNLFTEVCQAVVRRLVGRGIAPIRVDHVRQRHVAHAQRGIDAKNTEVVGDHVAALDSHQRRDLPLAMRAADVVGRSSEHQIVGMFRDSFADRVDLIERLLNRLGARDCAWNVDREENSAESALAHARDVDVAVRVPDADIKRWIEQPLRRIVVRIDYDGTEMQIVRFLRNNGRVGGRQRRERQHDREGTTERNDPHARHSSLKRTQDFATVRRKAKEHSVSRAAYDGMGSGPQKKTSLTSTEVSYMRTESAAREPGLHGVPQDLPVDGGDGFGERNPLRADLYAILRVVAILDSAGAHQGVEAFPGMHRAGRVQVEQAHLVDDRRADELRALVYLRANFEAIPAGDAARQRITDFLQ